MTDRMSSAFFTSLLLHGVFVAIIVLLAYTFNSMRPEVPKIFELVAGEGDNYAATAAPALGSPEGIKLAAPVPAAAVPEPTPPAPTVAEAMPAPTPVPAKVPVKTPAKPVDKSSITGALKRAEMRATVRQEAKDRKAAEAEKRKQMTEEEFRKEHGAAKVAGVGIRGGVVGGSIENKTGGAGGKALTREEGALLDAYFALLINRLRESFESAKPTDVSDKLTATAAFYVGADGTIANARIARSSGNDEFDQAVLEAVRHTRSIGPRPDHKSDEVSVPFSMHDETAP
jgi:colicin import membrane protein